MKIQIYMLQRPACRSNSLRMPSIKWPATAASDASGTLFSLSPSIIFIFSWSLGNVQDISRYHQLNVFAVTGFAEKLRGVNCSWHCIVVQSQDPMSWSDPLWLMTLGNSKRKSLSISMGCCLGALETQNRHGASTDMDGACWGKL